MMELKKCKKILQSKGKQYPDKEAIDIMEFLYQLSCIVDDVKAMEDEGMER